MDDIAIENYKKSVTKILEIWEKEAKDVGKELAPINAELVKLEATKAPSPADTKRIDELKKKREALYGRMNKASDELRLNLILISVPPKAPEKELIKLPDWLKEIIKKKGIPLGKNVTLAPKVDFDFKAKKLKYVGITIKW